MKRLQGIGLALLTAAGICREAGAALYYVDYGSGNDANNGTNTSAPWQHCPGDPAATGNAASATLAAGDVVTFKGGVTYTVAGARNITISESGSSGSPITYRSGDLVGWGTTPAFIDASAETNASSILRLNSASWITIDGLVVANLPVSDDYIGLIGGTVSSAGNITIQNCTLTNSAGCGIYLGGAWGTSRSNPPAMTVSNCAVRDSNWHGVFFRYGFDNIVITNCVIHNSGAPIYPGSYGGDNICFYYGSSDQMHNITVHGNQLSTTPTKGYILFYSPMTGLSVSGNYFHGTNKTGGLMFCCPVTNSVFYNNVFDTTISTYQGIYRFRTDTGNLVINGMQIYNNTIRAKLDTGAIFYFAAGNCTYDTMFYNVSIRNTIVVSTGTGIPAIEIDLNSAKSGPLMDMATFHCDYNTYTTTNSSLFVYCGDGKNLTQWQSTTGGDANSAVGTPRFVGANDLHLASSDTLARGKGVNLYALFTTDKDGNTWPSSGPWDIGAYVYVADRPRPPTSLRIPSSPP